MHHNQIIEEAKELSSEELHKLRATVDSMLAETVEPPMSEDEFELLLAAKGVISLPETSDEDNDDGWEPVEVTGKPLSEMIIEERR